MVNRAGDTRRQPTNGSAVKEKGRTQAAVRDEYAGLDPLEIPASLTVNDLAEYMDVSPIDVIKEFMRSGYMLTLNEVVEHDTVELIAPAFGYRVLPLVEEKGPASLVISSELEDPKNLETRPPVVTILGHVDHGKTTLLDAIRKSKVVVGEAGGITQHIGAYQVEYDGHPITFLDTPGHEAFTAMRARGAQVTDIAILVVAADDGIMPQTVEAIDHVKAAGVPMVVAINKVDKPGSDQERVKRQLAEHNLLIEEWGGDVISVPVSALKGDGISDLLENILVVAEVNDLKANPKRLAQGVVVEARIDKSRGAIATLLVQTGTLKVGDNVVVGDIRGRVKAMFTDVGKRIKSAAPSEPVEILGLVGLPQAGDVFRAVADEKTARQIISDREKERNQSHTSGTRLQDLHAKIESGEVKALNLVIKTDVQGSIEAMRNALERLNTEKTMVNLIHAAAGSVTESDVMLALASKAIIIAFTTHIEPGARVLADQEGVEIHFYDIIYQMADDIEKALKGLMEPVYRDIIEGRATVRAVFSMGRRSKVAGFFVNDGRIARDTKIHVLRGGRELYTGSIASLKHFKDDVREVANGFEGGLSLEGFSDFAEGDILEAHRSERMS